MFSRLYIALQIRDEDLEQFFEHENQACPAALSQIGKIRTSTKSAWFTHKKMYPIPLYMSSFLTGLLSWTCQDQVLLRHFLITRSKCSCCKFCPRCTMSADWMSYWMNMSLKVWRPKHAAGEGRKFADLLSHRMPFLETSRSFYKSMRTKLSCSHSWELMWKLLTQTNK